MASSSKQGQTVMLAMIVLLFGIPMRGGFKAAATAALLGPTNAFVGLPGSTSFQVARNPNLVNPALHASISAPNTAPNTGSKSPRSPHSSGSNNIMNFKLESKVKVNIFDLIESRDYQQLKQYLTNRLFGMDTQVFDQQNNGLFPIDAALEKNDLICVALLIQFGFKNSIKSSWSEFAKNNAGSDIWRANYKNMPLLKYILLYRTKKFHYLLSLNVLKLNELKNALVWINDDLENRNVLNDFRPVIQSRLEYMIKQLRLQEEIEYLKEELRLEKDPLKKESMNHELQSLKKQKMTEFE
eukprot:NODE_279_length_10886_cov_0.340039.p4 type:complete len:298 gc:universal NODE_279_length_10886_cov_0.340039:7937-7044(-)